MILHRISDLAYKETKKQMSKVKHGGAAGGIAAALHVFFNAELVNGAEYFLSLTNFEESLKKCDLLITGEGSLDEQTLKGKAPFALAKYAKKYKIPVIGLGGNIPLVPNLQMNKYFDVLIAIGNQPSDLSVAINNTKANLVRTGTMIGNLFTISSCK